MFNLVTKIIKIPYYIFSGMYLLIVILIVELRDRRSLDHSKISKKAAEEIVNTLALNNIIPKTIDPNEISSNYDIRNLIVEYYEDHHFEIWSEDWGSDNDAGEDYESLLRLFSKRSGNKMIFEDLKSETEGDDVLITFVFNGKPHRWEIGQYSDNLSEDFLEYFEMLQNESHGGKFVSLDGGDMPEFAFVPDDVYSILVKHEAIRH